METLIALVIIFLIILLIYFEKKKADKIIQRRIEIEDKIFESQWRTLCNLTKGQIKEKLSGHCGCKDIMQCDFRNGCQHLKDKQNQPDSWKEKLNYE